MLATTQGGVGSDGTSVFIGIDYDFNGFYNGFEINNGPGDANRALDLNTQAGGSGLSIGNSTAITFATTDDGTNLHRFVIQVDFGVGDTDQATLWRDGVNLGSTTATHDFAFDRVYFGAFVGGGIGGADNLIIADTFAEAAAIPEPSSALLFGLGGFALILRRRK